MVREAWHMSVVPLMRALIPVPEPPPVTWMVALGWTRMYSSAQRWPKITMVSEPLTVISPAAAANGASSAVATANH
jgi:hypothetical protein